MKLVQGSHQPCTQLSCGERGLLSITPFLPEPPTPLRDALHVRLLHLLLWFLESTFCASSVQFIPEGFTLFDAVVSEMSSFRAGLLISGVWKCSLFCLWTCACSLSAPAGPSQQLCCLAGLTAPCAGLRLQQGDSCLSLRSLGVCLSFSGLPAQRQPHHPSSWLVALPSPGRLSWEEGPLFLVG